MISEVLTITALMCNPTKTINKSDENWNLNDNKMMEFASKTCMKKYPIEAPCLVLFIKVKSQVYRAICGKYKK